MFLVQTEDYVSRYELFPSDYAYFSSTSSSWVEHARRYSSTIIKTLNLNENKFVVEVASNDGYLLTNFVKLGIPCLGIEPTKLTAKDKKIRYKHSRGIFDLQLAKKVVEKYGKADLIVANNVITCPDFETIFKGMKLLLATEGVITIEFPSLMNLIDGCQFDTVYHEHYSYFSLLALENCLSRRVYEYSILKRYRRMGAR